MSRRRRDVRRFGRGPYVLGMRRTELFDASGFPYEVPAVAAIEDLRLDAPITLLAGDNGSGKSTIVEAVAESMGFAAQGGELERSGALPPAPRAPAPSSSSPRTRRSCSPARMPGSTSSTTTASPSARTTRSTRCA